MTTVLSAYPVVRTSLNERLRPQGAGPWIQVTTEVGSDTATAISAATCSLEEGVIIAEIYDRIGAGTRALYTVYDLIRDGFRDQKLLPGVGEKGTFYFNDISTDTPTEVNDRKSRDGWLRLRCFIAYRKDYAP